MTLAFLLEALIVLYVPQSWIVATVTRDRSACKTSDRSTSVPGRPSLLIHDLPRADRMLVGYARVSTGEQNLDLQADALTQAGCEGSSPTR